MRRTIPLAPLLFIAGCLVSRGRGEPLYPVTGERLPSERVAQLEGYIRKIDDNRVDEGKAFELLPGCHVIETPAKWGQVSSSGGVMVDTGNQVFALPMKAGYRYKVDVSVKMMGGSLGSAAIEAVEQDPKGNKTVIVGSGILAVTPEACRAAESAASK